MSKERLVEIEKRAPITQLGMPTQVITWEGWKNVVVLFDEDYKYLINTAKEQAERVRELEDVLYQDPRQEVLEGMYEENKLYRATINAMQQILKDAIHSLDNGEKVQGLEYGVKIANEALEDEE